MSRLSDAIGEHVRLKRQRKDAEDLAYRYLQGMDATTLGYGSCEQYHGLPKRWFTLPQHSRLAEVWNGKARFKLVIAGRRSYKSELAKRIIVREAIRTPGKYVFLGPTHNQVKEIAWDDLKALVPAGLVSKRPNETDKIIKLVNGSRIRLGSFDRPERNVGTDIDGAVVTERYDCPPGKVVQELLPATMNTGGWMLEEGVPKRSGPSRAEMNVKFDKAIQGKLPNTSAHEWRSSDVVPAERLADLKASMDEKSYDEQINANRQVSASGLVYYAFSRSESVRPCAYDPTLPILVGSDFNVSPMAWVLAHERHGAIEVFAELFINDCNTPMALSALWERFPRHAGGWAFYGDATGKNRKTSALQSDFEWIEADPRFKSAGRTIHYPASNPPVGDRYAVVNSAFKAADGKRSLFIDPSVVELIKDCEYLPYGPDGKASTKDPDRGHASDGLGYLVMWKHRIGGEREEEPLSYAAYFGS
jgi:hypothetical protein